MESLSRKLSVLAVAMAFFLGAGVVFSSPSYAATFNGARNGLVNNGGYVELGGTLTRKTVINTNGNWIGIGTSSPRRTLHLNSGTNNSPFELQSTDPYALMTFSDNTTNPVDAVWIGALGDQLVVGQGAEVWMNLYAEGPTAGISGHKSTVRPKSNLPTYSDFAQLFVWDVWGDFVDANDGMWVWGNPNTLVGEIYLDPSGTATVYNDFDTITGPPASGDCDSSREYGRTIMEDGIGGEKLWVCTDSGWRSLTFDPPTK